MWQDRSMGIKFLTLKFDLKKTSNLGHSVLTIRFKAYIFYMCIPCGKAFHVVGHDFDLATLTLMLGLPLKNFNFGHDFLTIRGKDFHILHGCCKTFYAFVWFWPSNLVLEVWHTYDIFLTLPITFEPEEVERSNFTCVFLMTTTLTVAITFEKEEVERFFFTCAFLMVTPCILYLNFWLCDLDLACWRTFQKICSGPWLLNRRIYLLLLFAYGYTGELCCLSDNSGLAFFTKITGYIDWSTFCIWPIPKINSVSIERPWLKLLRRN